MAGRHAEEPNRTCVVVDDDERLRSVLAEALALRGFSVREAGTVREAVGLIAAEIPDLLVLDVALPDGSGLDVLGAVAEHTPTPRVVAVSGEASADEGFALAQRGVRAFLQKPFTLNEMETAIDRALNTPPDLKPHLKAAVGLLPVQGVEQSVRSTMVEEALARSNGNRRAAARALRISRELLQHILRKG